MTQEKLEFTTRQVTQSRARAAEVVRVQLRDAGVHSRGPDDISKHLRRHPVAPDATGLVDRPEDGASVTMVAAAAHASMADLTHCGIGTVLTWPPFADEVGDDPVLLSLLDGLQRERQQLAPAQSAADKHSQQRVVAEVPRGCGLGVLQESPALLGCQPVPPPDAETPHDLHAADTGGEFRAEEAGVGRLVGHPTHSSQAQVDRAGAY